MGATHVSTRGRAHAASPGARLGGRALLLARVGWLALAAGAAGLFVASVAQLAAAVARLCPTAGCASAPLAPATLRAIHALGLPVAFVLNFGLLLAVLVAAVYGAAALLVFARKSDDRMALLVSLALFLFGTATFTGTLDALPLKYPATWPLVVLVEYLGSAGFILFLYTFPDGRFVPGWTRWAALAWLVQQLPHFAFKGTPADSSTWPRPLDLLLWAAFLGSVIYAQAVRYRRVSTEAQRQQTKWVVIGIAAGLIGLLAGYVMQFAGAAGARSGLPTTEGGLALYLAGGALADAAMLLVPISIGIALLRYRLFDVDTLLSRALVYGALTASVIALYALVVGGLSLAFQVRANPIVSLVATGVVAVAFQPLRERLQRGVNRLVYGQRDEPYAVLARLGRRLEAALAPEAALPAVVETVAGALKLPYAAIALREGDGLAVAAETGTPAGESLQLPLVYQSEMVGELRVAPRGPGEAFTAADRSLLGDIAREAGVAAHAVRLTADLKRLNRDLQSSRVRLISAREEERRRLRRDLHDGLGSALTSITFKLGAARNLLGRDPAATERLLDELKGQTQAAIADIRHLVYDLRPPALDELGLVSALREYAGRYDLGGVRVSVEAQEGLPPLPAATELAAYRIALEALANVARHAHAATCAVRLRAEGEALLLEVEDDGVGLPAERRAGVGLAAMRERAEELGGVCTAEARPAGGTRVAARLPLLDG